MGLLAQSRFSGLALLQWAVIAGGVFSHVTAIQRLAYARRMLSDPEAGCGLRKRSELIWSTLITILYAQESRSWHIQRKTPTSR